ncbi:hypothetical protein [Mesorhizobium caraganae]|uniref:hypothetical protein n=1 Tax=Mesorhizobium caraganae TaxID=483206 RepID=UPI003335374C
MAKVPGCVKTFAGLWRIVGMDVWDNDFLDLVGGSASDIQRLGGWRDRLQGGRHRRDTQRPAQ